MTHILKLSVVWLGALATAILFTVGQVLIGWYLGRGTVSSAYGAAGSLAVLLIWIFYSMQIILIGAEFTQVYTRHFGSKKLGELSSPQAAESDSSENIVDQTT